VILFTLDESSYSRELAPLAGHYPILSSAALVVLDSPEECCVTSVCGETAGFYNTVASTTIRGVSLHSGPS